MTDEVRCAVTGSDNTAPEAEAVQGLAEEEPDMSEELAAQASEAAAKPPALKQITVPDIQDMDYYIRRHYRSYMISALNEWLTTGDLSELFGTPIITPESHRDDCRFTNMTYWRMDRATFLADIDVQVELKVDQGQRDSLQPFSLYISLWIDEDFECSLHEIGRLMDKPDRGAWKLDRYLVPILHVEEMERGTESMWRKKIPEALNDANLRKAAALARAYGLTVIPLRLYKRKNTRSILFFREGSILVQDEKKEGEDELPPPREVTVPAKTIVMNSLSGQKDDGELDIYHECIHYEWHYLFYRLQDMYNDDLQQIRMKQITVSVDRNPASPLRFIEKQTHRGSYSLMMPYSVMQEKVYREFQRASAQLKPDDYYKHEGWKYDRVGRAIAREFNLMKSRVRTRLILMGYNAAKGALNYVDGRYIVPFAFSGSYADQDSDTFVIDRKGIDGLYRRDRKFRNLMARGDYVYVDGHLCFNDPEYIRMTPDGARLTPWANAHVDSCCLHFAVVYKEPHSPEYVFGRMNSDEVYDRHYHEYLDRMAARTARERTEAKNRLMAGMPLSFHETLEYLMRDHGCGKITVEKLSEDSQISQRTIIRLRNEERVSYKLDLVVALCIGLHIPPWLSEVLLDKARLSVKRYGEFGYYGEILDCNFMDTVGEVQVFLTENGYKPLNLKDE